MILGLFDNSKKDSCPVDEETRLWLERCMLWLTSSFGKDSIKNRKVLIPDYKDFPIQYNGQHWSVVFDSQNTNTLQYVTNLTTGIQYKWQSNQWTKSYDGVYLEGAWNLSI